MCGIELCKYWLIKAIVNLKIALFVQLRMTIFLGKTFIYQLIGGKEA
jgi:hypothetical protein